MTNQIKIKNMKHLGIFKSMILIIFATILNLTFTSCSEDDTSDVIGTSIVGTWVTYEDKYEKFILTFNKNGYATQTIEYYNDLGELINKDITPFQYTYNSTEKELTIIGADTEFDGTWEISITVSKMSLGYYVFDKV